jgi:hypothetical protein
VRKTVPLGVLLNCLRAVAAGSSWMEQDNNCDLKRPPRADRSLLRNSSAERLASAAYAAGFSSIGTSL